jgi:hypothetical protein
MTQAQELDALTEAQLKSKLCDTWAKHKDAIRKEMAPPLYHLREKLKAQGKAGSGFGAWVEQNLEICRRTADRWADGYAKKEGLKSTSDSVTESKTKKGTSGQVSKSDRKVTVDLNFPKKDDADDFRAALKLLGAAEAHDIIWNAIITAAHALKKPAASALHDKITAQGSVQ